MNRCGSNVHTMKCRIIPFALIALHLLLGVQSSDILMVMYFASKSHKNVFEPLAQGLAERGHNVTLVTPFPKTRNITGVREVNPNLVVTTLPVSLKRFQKPESINKIEAMLDFFDATTEMCDAFLASTETEDLMKSRYDLVLIDGLQNDCVVGMAYRMQVPFGYLHTSAFLGWHSVPTRLPLPSSVIPNEYVGFTSTMTFWERLLNFVLHNLGVGLRHLYSFPKEDALMRRRFGDDLPSIEYMEREVSLIMSNQHFSLEYPRAWLPGMIEVGGMHCRPAQKLPESFLDFVEGSSEGFLYFSLGTVVLGSQMDPQLRDAFLDAFSRLRVRVLWKWETEVMEGVTVPKNVKLSKWLPQQDVLGHPKCRLFITHGGLLGQQEAIYHGVPMLVIPFFGDQFGNAARAVRDGYALRIDLGQVTSDTLHQAITSGLKEPSQFRQRMMQLSSIYHDQQETPLERAIFWTEYVIRHKGAGHMRSSARNMPLYQVYLVDVIAFIVLALIVVSVTLVIAVRTLLRMAFGIRHKK